MFFLFSIGTESTEQKLLNTIMIGYNKDAYPVPNAKSNRSLSRVRFSLELVQLVNVVRNIKTSLNENTSAHKYLQVQCSLRCLATCINLMTRLVYS